MSEDKQSAPTASTSSIQQAVWKKYLNKLAFWKKDKNRKANNKVQLIPRWALLLLLAIILAWIFLVIFLPVYYATTTNSKSVNCVNRLYDVNSLKSVLISGIYLGDMFKCNTIIVTVTIWKKGEECVFKSIGTKCSLSVLNLFSNL